MKHQKVIDAIQENIKEEGDCVTMTLGNTVSCVGTVDAVDLEDFFHTMFRISPGLKDLVERAIESTSCSLH